MAWGLLDLLLPKEAKFYDYMERQVVLLTECCRLFNQSLDYTKENGYEQRKACFAGIKDCELKGDALEVEILDDLRRAFITPIDREDIHKIVMDIDTALDILNGTARKMDVYDVWTLPSNVRAMTVIISSIVAQLGALIGALKANGSISDCIAAMHHLENEADELFHQCMLDLFNDGYSAVEIIKMKEIYERLEGVVDTVDHIGKHVRGIRVING